MTIERFPFMPAASPLATAAGLLKGRRRCPSCGGTASLRRMPFTPPADYAEPAPTYHRCDGCSARFVRTAGLGGSWIDASGAAFDAAFRTD